MSLLTWEQVLFNSSIEGMSDVVFSMIAGMIYRFLFLPKLKQFYKVKLNVDNKGGIVDNFKKSFVPLPCVLNQ